MSEGRGLLRANVVVASGTFISRLTGFLRLFALAYALGQTGLTDAYTTANNTPNIIYELIIGGVLTATLVPVFVRAFDDEDDDAVSAVTSVAVAALVALTVTAVLAAPWIMRVYSAPPGADAGPFRDEAVQLARLFLPQILFYGLTALGAAMLNSRRRFAAPAWAPVLNNLVVIAVLLALPRIVDGPLTLQAAAEDERITWVLGLGTTAGVVVMTVALWPSIRASGVRLSWRPDWSHPAVRRVVAMSGWTVGYVAANQVALVVVARLALREGAGWMSAYQAAFVFFQLPHGLVAVSIMTTFAPDLASAAGRADWRRFRSRVGYGLRLMGLLVLPASAGYAVLARPLVAALLQHGEFDAVAAGRTASMLVPFALGLFFFSAYLFVLRGFYALEDTRTPFLVNVVENLVNVVLAVVLVRRFGPTGLAASYAMAYAFASVLAFGVLARRVGGFRTGRLAGRLLPPAAMSVVMAVAVTVVTDRVGGPAGTGALVRVAVGVVVGVVVYVGGLSLLGRAARRVA